jgi:hypothetical protein
MTPRALGPLHDIGHQTGGALEARLRSGTREEIFAALLEELSGPRHRHELLRSAVEGSLSPVRRPRCTPMSCGPWSGSREWTRAGSCTTQ